MTPDWLYPSNYDYTIVDSGITFTVAPAINSIILVDYIYI